MFSVGTKKKTSFLSEMLDFESGLNPSLWKWYSDNLDNAVVTFWKVSSPGRVVLDDETGFPLIEKVTVLEYFDSLGVRELYRPTMPSSLRDMQFASINPWGFVGYQIGEKALIELGGYSAGLHMISKTQKVNTFYVGAEERLKWLGSEEKQLHWNSDGIPILATVVNEWRGTFSGIVGLDSLDDLRTEHVQEKLMHSLMQHNINDLCRSLEEKKTYLGEVMKNKYFFDGPLTLSGVLAAAHLCGTSATLKYLLEGTSAIDEVGTSIGSYAQRFSGLTLPNGLLSISDGM